MRSNFIRANWIRSVGSVIGAPGSVSVTGLRGRAGCPNTGCPNTGCPNTGCPNTGCPNTGCPNTGCPNTGCQDGRCVHSFERGQSFQAD
ncbi:hypothetical protein [Stieleria bergensis]|uniref:hypothetical protein n=1 Tax=Stieleria bergensis TaxID=2528025 RepID=UPI003AF3F61A